MLTHLSIRDLVLIEQVELELGEGLTALTGETGAGKSILLDGLGLALGNRADQSMVRRGASQAAVTARFDVPTAHPAMAWLDDNGLPVDEPGEIVMRRVVKADGGSRAFINGQPVAAGMLRNLGSLLVEIHGQHDERSLLNPRGHLNLLDLFAGHGALVSEVQAAHLRWRTAAQTREDAEARAEADARDREWLEHAVSELTALNPQPGEEEELAEARSQMQKGAKLADALDQIDTLISGADGALSQLRQAARRLERIGDQDEGLQAALDATDRALTESDQIETLLADVRHRLRMSPKALEEVEARLFDLRAMARKHRVECEALPALVDQLSQRLATIEGAADNIGSLKAAEAKALAELSALAARLSAERQAAAERLDRSVNIELPALKLESARFRTAISEVPLGETGQDQVRFEVATNAGHDFGPLTRIASGGELSRFILALKVALAGRGTAGTLIFDEIDRGVGGATASAIGERLRRVAEEAQLLVVTHSPQVAAAGSQHARISKQDGHTQVRPLDVDARIGEIARMLSGADITSEARAQAAVLLSAFL